MCGWDALLDGVLQDKGGGAAGGRGGGERVLQGKGGGAAGGRAGVAFNDLIGV